jgi:transcriptional regulator of acetoin/glycerol metabolism
MSAHWHHDDVLFEAEMKKLKMPVKSSITEFMKTATQGLSDEAVRKLAQRIAKHDAPGIYLTTEQLGEAMIRTVQQMSPDEKAELRRSLDCALLTKAAVDTELIRIAAATVRESDREWLESLGVRYGL